MDGAFKKVLAVSAALALSRSFHLSDNKGKLVSQLTKSSIASSASIFERSSPSLNGKAAALPLSPPNKPNVTQRAFSVIEISPILRATGSKPNYGLLAPFLNRLDLGLERVKPCDRARDANQIVCLFGSLNFSFDGRSFSRPSPHSFKLQDPGPNRPTDVGAAAECKQ
jgi:hypothetical protein